MTVAQAFSERNRRLELRMRPDDVYCRPACADRHKVTGLLLSVKVRRRKGSGEVLAITPSVVGRVNVAFKFTSEFSIIVGPSLAQFQIEGKCMIVDGVKMGTNIISPMDFSKKFHQMGKKSEILSKIFVLSQNKIWYYLLNENHGYITNQQPSL